MNRCDVLTRDLSAGKTLTTAACCRLFCLKFKEIRFVYTEVRSAGFNRTRPWDRLGASSGPTLLFRIAGPSFVIQKPKRNKKKKKTFIVDRSIATKPPLKSLHSIHYSFLKRIRQMFNCIKYFQLSNSKTFFFFKLMPV